MTKLRGESMKNNTKEISKPIFSLIGIGLFILTVVVHLSYKFLESRINDVGVGMMLSLCNALLSVFTLLWSIVGINEFRLLLTSYKSLGHKMNTGEITSDHYNHEIKIHKNRLAISVSYLVLVLFQLLYVLLNLEEIDI
jgi:hypothetical protein